MPQLLDKTGLQHYANKMVLAENRKVGSKPLPTALNDIDTAIDKMKTLFDQEYGTALDMKLENTKNVFSIGTESNLDKRNEVENSFTDIEIKGDTLVNLFKNVTHLPTSNVETVFDGNKITYSKKTDYTGNIYPEFICGIVPSQELKTNTVYTLIFESEHEIESFGIAFQLADGNITNSSQKRIVKGRNFLVFTSPESFDNYTFKSFYLRVFNGLPTDTTYVIKNLIFLEGDYTNKSFPQYFTSLKSVGEKEDKNHKISISSIGKNILDLNNVIAKANADYKIDGNKFIISTTKESTWANVRIKCYVKPNTNYYCGFEVDDKQNSYVTIRDGLDTGILVKDFATTSKVFNSGNRTSISVMPHCTRGTSKNNTSIFSNFYIAESNIPIDYEPYKADKKEVPLSIPLRKIPDGVKDTIEKVNNEWKIIRRCGEVLLNDTYHVELQNDNSIFPNGVRFVVSVKGCSRQKIRKKVVSNNFYSSSENGIHKIGLMFSYLGAFYVYPKDCVIVEEFKTWLTNNPTKVVYELDTPIIENIDPITLQCWKNGTIVIDDIIPVDTTHTVSLNKPAQIKKNIEELTILKQRVQALEKNFDKMALEQAHQLALIENAIKLDTI